MTKNPPTRLLPYLRSTLFLAGFFLFTAIYSCPMVCSFLLPLAWRYRMLRVYPLFSLWLLKICCGLQHRIEGRENLPDQPSIIFAKHQSTWETLALILCLPAAVYVAKRELLWIPFFGWGMAALQFITINRSAGRQAVAQMVRQAQDRLARGLWIIIFPEGTRRAPGAPPQYKIGGAIMAMEAGVPLVPIAHNAGDFWPRHSLIKWPGEISLVIGPPITAQHKTPEQIRSEAQGWIEATMKHIARPERFSR